MSLKHLLAIAAVVSIVPRCLMADTAVTTPRVRSVVIVPGASSVKLTITGKLKLIAAYSGEPVAKVAFTVDDKPVGDVKERPYSLAWDSQSLPIAEHIVAWKAIDSDGKETGRGSMTLLTGKPAETPATTEPGQSKSLVPYSNHQLDLDMEIPSSWTAKDQSKNLEKDFKDGYWLVFSTDPVAKASLVFNLRYRVSEVDQTQESFAKYATYVQPWQRIDVSGRPAFFTTAGAESSKRVVHRCIILEGKKIWMANLIDTSGKPAAESKRAFQQMLRSINPDLAQPKGEGK